MKHPYQAGRPEETSF